jgi:hypothetical protein
VTAVPQAAVATGAVMFARYAFAPNDLGFCGPAGSTALRSGTEAEIRAAARRFSGAWPYLQVLARLAGVADPLDEQVVASYWHGGGVGARVDPREFGAELLAVIGPQAGPYWAHLTDDLLDEAAPDHAFHVFGVYPWTRLLGRGMDEQPMHVLDSCRIGWGTVVDPGEETARVETRPLVLADGVPALGAPEVRTVAVEHEGHARVPDLAEGDLVALHWGRICDRLTPEQVGDLERSTARQLAATAARLRRTRDGS